MATRLLSSGREGFTILEVLVAMLLLSSVVLGLGAAAGGYLNLIASADERATAIQMVEDRLAEIQADPNYAILETRYEGTDTTVGTGNQQLTRSTVINRTQSNVQGGGVIDFKRITVTVAGPAVDTLSRSATVAAP